MTSTVRVLIVDDSALFVDALTGLLEADPGIRVVGVAADGASGIAAAQRLRPDLITMDLEMPGLTGLEAIEHIMSACPTPILVLTGKPATAERDRPFDALSRGALDLVQKDVLLDDDRAGAALRERVHLLASIPVIAHARRSSRTRDAALPPAAAPTAEQGAVGIVASTGGPSALNQVLAALPADFPLPIAVVQHLARGFCSHFADWLGGQTKLRVCLAKSGERARPGTVYIAPDDLDLELSVSGVLRLTQPRPGAQHCPSGDVLLHSIARSCGSRAIGVVLTGMGNDGAAGLLAMRAQQALTIAQDGRSSIVDGMPRVARESGAALESWPLDQIATRLLSASRRLSQPPSRRGSEA